MKKILVFYKSNTGFTERYARWIADDLGADVMPLDEVSSATLEAYDLLVFGGPLFASRIAGLNKVQTWMGKLSKKTWVVFATGATPSDKTFVKSIEQINFPPNVQKPARFYYFLSGINFEKMGWFNRLLIRIFGRMSQKRVKGASASASSQFRSVDLADKVYIEPLIRYIQLKQ